MKEILGKRKMRKWLIGKEGTNLISRQISSLQAFGKKEEQAYNVADKGEQSLRYGIEREQTTLLGQNLFCCVLGRVRLLTGESGLSVTILVGVSKASLLVTHN